MRGERSKHRRTAIAVLLASGLVLGAMSVALAADPKEGAVGPDSPLLQWTGKRYAIAQQSNPQLCPRSADPTDSFCDHFMLTVNADAAYWSSHRGGVEIEISWESEDDNFDLYVFEAESGEQVASSGAKGTTSEEVLVENAAGQYEVRVLPTQVVDSGYVGNVSFLTSGGGGGGGEDPPVTDQYFSAPPDSSNWYWRKQKRELVGAGPAATYVSLPNPQAQDTLPVAVEGGEHEKISALLFDLAARGMQPGTVITKFVLTIAEGSGQEQSAEQPSFNTANKVILACPATDYWVSGAAELFDLAPKHEEAGCVEGQVNADVPTARKWVFDLTAMAEPWGENPLANTGIVFLGKIPEGAGAGETWQINLKIPQRNNETTPGIDEYETTKKRVIVQLETKKARPPTTPPPTTPPPTTPPTSPSPADTGDDDFIDTGSGSGFTGGGDFDSGTTDLPPAAEPPPAPEPPPAAEPVETLPVALPKLPAYVWLLIPVGLLALTAVRTVVMEVVTGTRPDGVIAAIRKRNEELRGLNGEG